MLLGKGWRKELRGKPTSTQSSLVRTIGWNKSFMIMDMIHYDARTRIRIHQGQACGPPPSQSLCHIMWGRKCKCGGGGFVTAAIWCACTPAHVTTWRWQHQCEQQQEENVKAAANHAICHSASKWVIWTQNSLAGFWGKQWMLLLSSHNLSLFLLSRCVDIPQVLLNLWQIFLSEQHKA